MNLDAYKLKIYFLTPVLGSQPTTEVASEYLAKKAGLEFRPDDEALLDDVLERGTTVFHRLENGDPCLMNYHVLGFLKESGKVQNGKSNVGGIKNLRFKVGSQVFITPRQLPLVMPKGDGIDYLERPLRAETALGPRVLVARSEMAPEGSTVSCSLEVMHGEISQNVLLELLDYGFYRGLCQWRGSGAFGTFRYELSKDE
jgi:hypothetical protein